MVYQVNLKEYENIVLFECYGDRFPVHPEEWKKYGSLWQEDYFRCVLQTDIQILTIYYANCERHILWESGFYHFKSIHDVYNHMNNHRDPFLGFIFGDHHFMNDFDKNRMGQTTHIVLENFRDAFNKAYELYFLTDKD